MSLLGLGSGSNAGTPTELTGYRVQTSIFGGGIPLVLGTNRLAGNVIWLGDWDAQPVNSSGKAGGKGAGGGKGGTGQFNYSASYMVALCQGPCTSLVSVWIDKTPVSGGSGYPVFISGGLGQGLWGFLTSNHPGEALGYSEIAIAAWEKNSLGTGGNVPNYSFEVQGQACYGAVVSSFGSSVFNFSFSPLLNNTQVVVLSIGGAIPTGLSQGQTYWTVNATSASVQLALTQGGTPITFSGGSNYVYVGMLDAIASDAIYFVLNAFNAANFPAAAIGSMAGAAGIANYCLANGIAISPVIDTQQTIQTYLQEYLLVANSEAFSSEGLIKFATYGDKAVTGNGVTFTPDLSPVYSLDYDAFIVDGAKNPITFTVEPGQDANNQLSFEWTNRARQYNLETVTDDDQDAVNKYGLNIGSVQTIHSVCNASVAQQVLSVQLKRSVYILRKAQFTLGWAYSLLEPMDIVLVPEQYPSTDTVGVRLLTITEDEKGNFACEGEVLPFPILSPVIHPKQASGGYTPGYGTNPSATNAPVFFEATPEMLNQILVTQLTLFIALSGGPSWGGCGVYLSTDGGVTYPGFLGQQTAGSNMGFLTADYPFGADPDEANVLSVNLQESLGEPADSSVVLADADKSLAVIDQELISYAYSNLSGANTYNFETAGGAIYTRRGVFGSNETLHKSGAAIALLDGNQFDVPYQPGDIGKTWYFKFPGFNKAGQQVQDLADAVPYAFTLTAPYTRGPLALKPAADAYIFAPSGFAPALAQVNGGASLQISVTPTANSFSDVVTAPVIDFAAVVSPSGGHLPQGSFVGQVFAQDSSGDWSMGSNLTGFDTVNTVSQITFGITLPYGTVAYEAFIGKDLDTLFGQGVVTGTPSSLTFTTLFTSGYGPPDGRAVAYHARGKRVIHGGLATATVVSSTSTTVVIGIPSAPTSNEFAGRTLIAVSAYGLPVTQSYDLLPVVSSDTGSPSCTLTVGGLGTEVGTGDLVLISLTATATSADSITDTGVASPYAPGGLTAGASVGNILRVLHDPTGSAIPGDTASITGNTSDTWTVTPWARIPGVGTVFIEEEPTWRGSADNITTAAQNYVQPDVGVVTPVAAVATTDLQGYVALIELLAQDANENDSPELGDGFRMIYVVPQAMPAAIPVTNNGNPVNY